MPTLTTILYGFAVYFALIGAWLCETSDPAGLWFFYASAILGVIGAFGDPGDDFDGRTPA